MTVQIRPTLDELLAQGWIGARQEPEFRAVAEIKVEGRRLGEIPPGYLSTSAHEYRYGKKASEVRFAAHALVGAGVFGANLILRERPDLEIRFPDRTLFAEVAEIHEPCSARYTNTLATLKNAARDRLAEDPALQAALGECFLSIILAQCPSKVKGRRIVDEVAMLISTRIFETFPRRELIYLKDARLPILTAHGAKIYIADEAGGLLEIRPDAGWFDPLAMLPIVSTVLYRKKQKALTYPVIPDLLILAVTDMRGSFTASMNALAQMAPDIAPYRAVLISYEGNVVRWGKVP